MAAARQQVNKQALKALVPLNGLSHSHFDELVAKSEVKDLPAGRFLFREGDRDGLTYFLLAGDIALMQGREAKQTLSAGSSEACHPIGHTQPRQWSAKAQSRVSVLAVDSGLLDVLLAWDQANSYEVTDIQSEDDEDWMTRMLSSELFQRLPASNIQQVLMRMQEVEVEAGTRIVTQDEEGDYYYIVKHGTADVTRKPSSHAKPIKIAQLRDGDSFGEEALLSGGARNASVTMASNGVLMRLAKSDFDALLREPLIDQVDYKEAQAIVKQGAVWLDVRLPGEFDNAHLPDSSNLPLAAVRDASAELNPSRRFIVCCDTGTRSVGAAFLLRQRGFDALVLRGGLNAVPHEHLQRAESALPASGSAEIIKFNSRDEPQDTLVQVSEAAAATAGTLSQADQEKTTAIRKELASIQAQVNERQERIATLEQAILDKEKELRALHRSFENAESMGEDLERVRGELDQARQQLAQQHSQLEEARNIGAEREQEIMALRDQAAELQQQVQHAETSRAEHEQQRAALQSQLDALRQSDAEQERQLRDSLQQTEAERDRVRAELDDRQQTLNRLESQLEELRHGRSEQESAAAEQRQQTELELQDLKQALQDLRAERDALRAQMETVRGEADAARRELEKRLEESCEENTELRRQLDRQVEELRALHEHEQGELSARLQDLETQLQASTQSLAEREAAVADLDAQIQRVQSERDTELQQARDEWNARRTSLEGEVASLQSQEQKLAETVQRLERERDASADELQTRINELEGELRTRDQALAEAGQSLAVLREEVESLQNARADVEEALSAREQQWLQSEQALRGELEQTQTQAQSLQTDLQQLQEREAQSEELQSRILVLERNLASGAAVLAQRDAALADVETQLIALQEQHTALRCDFDAALARESQLRGELEQLQKDRAATGDELSARIQELEATLSARSEALDEQNTDRERLKAELDELQTQYQKLQNQRDTEQKEWQGLRAEIEQRAVAAESEANAAQDTLEQERVALQSQSQAESERMQRECARLERDRDDATRALETAREEQDHRKAELKELQDERKKLKEQVAELENWLVRAERKRDDHQSALEAREQELATLRGELDEAHREAHVARERAAALQEEVDADGRQADQRSAQLREDAASARAELRNLEQRLEQAERSAAHAQEDRASAVQAHDEIKDNVESLEQELSQLRALYQDAADEAARGREESEKHLRALRDEESRARERLAEITAEQNDTAAALQALERETDSLRHELDQTRVALKRAESESARLGSALEQREGLQSPAEIESIRELADQELRLAAGEIAGLKGELEEARHQVRHLEAEVVLIRQLDGGSDSAPRAGSDIQLQLEERLAQYKRDADAALAGVREQNVALQSELQRLQRASGASTDDLPAMRAGEPSGRQAGRRQEHNVETDPSGPAFPSPERARRGTPVWLTLLLALFAVAGGAAAWWFWQQSSHASPSWVPGNAVDEARFPAKQVAPPPHSEPPQSPVTLKQAPAPDTQPDVAEAAPMRPGRTYQDFLDNGALGPVMVQLPGGRFTMGSAEAAPYFDERPARAVTLKPFSIAKYEVTFADFDRFVKATGRELPPDNGWGRDRRPVTGVSWTDAKAYADWLSASTGHRYRLPSEAEWEYASRGGTETFYWWGNDGDGSKANCFNCAGEWSGTKTAPVGSFAANPMGLYDTAGNALEWVQDCYRETYDGAPKDGSAVDSTNCTTRVARGGSYRSVLDNLRSARRAQYNADTRLDQLGFRLVREP